MRGHRPLDQRAHKGKLETGLKFARHVPGKILSERGILEEQCLSTSSSSCFDSAHADVKGHGYGKCIATLPPAKCLHEQAHMNERASRYAPTPTLKNLATVGRSGCLSNGPCASYFSPLWELSTFDYECSEAEQNSSEKWSSIIGPQW